MSRSCSRSRFHSARSIVPLIATVMALALSGVPGTSGRVAAVGVDPNIQVTPQNAQFGEVMLGTTSPVVQFTITSSGDAPVELGARSTIGDNAADFETTADTCPVGALAIGDSCTIDVRFAPLAEGTRQAVITFAGNWASSPALLPLGGWGIRPESGISWGTLYKPGPSYTWTYGTALGRTVQDGTQRLHQAYASDRVSGAWANDTGPYAGIYYTRGSSGSTWSTPRRITSTSKHVIRFGLAAAGSRVYVAYATQTRIYNYSPTAPRVLYVRRNTNHGGGSSWQASVRLTGTTGRVDYPTIAASGYDVHVAWTNSVTGDIMVATSTDRGVSFTKRVVGTTTVSGASGFSGLPSVAVSGSTVAVTWVSDDTGTVRTRVSGGSRHDLGYGRDGRVRVTRLRLDRRARVARRRHLDDRRRRRRPPADRWHLGGRDDRGEPRDRGRSRSVRAGSRAPGVNSHRGELDGGRGQRPRRRGPAPLGGVARRRRDVACRPDDRAVHDNLLPTGERLGISPLAVRREALRLVERVEVRIGQLPPVPAHRDRCASGLCGRDAVGAQADHRPAAPDRPDR